MKIRSFFAIVFCLVLLSAAANYAQSGSALTLSEVMFYPSETNGEYIEIYNTSLTETIDLSTIKFKYSTSSNNSFTAFIGGANLAPGKYAVVLQGNYDYNNGAYKNIIPADAIILKLSTNNFGSSGMANTTSRDVYLINASGTTIDTYTYSADNNAGISDEKYLMTKDNGISNWRNSIKLSGTPGYRNSVTPVKYINDLSVRIIGLIPANPVEGDSVQIKLMVKNSGVNDAGQFSVDVFKDSNTDSVGQQSEKFFTKSFPELFVSDSVLITSKFYADKPGKISIIANVNYSLDENVADNKLIVAVNVVEKPVQYTDVVVNEIMYAPTNEEPEWIELYNKSSRLVNLKNWKISDNSTTATITTSDYILNPGEYVVISGDATIVNFYPYTIKTIVKGLPSFGNSGDDVILKSGTNTTIDSIKYMSAWGGTGGYSLEKISIGGSSNDPLNWKTSISRYKATPGNINSVTQKNNDLQIKSFAISASYAEVGKNIQLNAVVENIGKTNAASFTVKLFRDANLNGVEDFSEQIAELPGINLSANATASFSFSTNNFQAGKNQLIVRVDFSGDEYAENNSSLLKVTGVILNEAKGDLVINEVLYSAKSVTQQWIEIFNKSQKIINLKGYQIYSNGKKNKVITGETFIKPDNYFVIARDTSVFGFNSKLTAVSISDFTTLTGKVAILDSLNRTIDSLEYKSVWGGSVGKSLERIDPAKTSTDSTNWKTSTSKYGGTPGGINSITQKNFDLYVKSFLLATPFAEVGKNASLTTLITNNGKSLVQSFSVKLFKDVNFNGIEESNELIAELPGANLGLGASASFSFSTNNIQAGQNQFIVRVDFANDEFVENNSSLLKTNGIVINEVRGDLVINEIMYSSRYVSQQWLEIYNKSQKIINLNGYQILSGTKKTKVISKNVLINPDNYIVIARDSSVFNFNPKLTAAIIMEFTSFSGKVAILDSLNRAIDSLDYKSSWGGNAGKSLERIDVAKTSTDSTNWKTSVNPLGATPGLVNSYSKKNYDIALTKFSFNPTVPSIGQRVRIRVDVSNSGRNDASFKLVLSRVNKDGTKLKVEETSTLSLSKEASLTYEFTYAIESLQAKTSFECSADFLLDEDVSNNLVSGYITPGYLAGAVLLNEIMFNPLNGEPEWIELYNNSNYDVDLEGWSISDVLTTPQKISINAKDYSFSKNSFLVVAKDSTIKNYHSSIQSKLVVSTFPTLNNDADGIVIKDSRGATIDSILFDTKWGGESGKSIERKQLSSATQDKNNWASSKDIELSTPGRANSVAIKKNDLTVRAIIPSPLYPALNEEINIGAKILNYGTSIANSFSVKFYSKENNTYTKFAEVSSTNLNPNDSVIVFSNTKIKLASTKTFMAKVVYSADEDTLNNSITAEVIPGTKPNSILITEIMYSPLTGEPEWVEFVNASNEAINLKGWSISDLLPTPIKAVLTTRDDLIQPGEFAIATPDTNSYAFNPPKKFYQAKFGSLSNTNDGVLIYDFRNAVIDSINYRSSWGGGSGASLERISLSKATNDSTNWITSLSKNGASAGIKNSVASSIKYAKNSLVINEIMYEPETGKTEFLEFYNPTNDSVQVGGMELKVGDKSKVKLALHSFVVPPRQYFVTASDSSIYNNFPLLKNSGQVSISSSLSLSNEGSTLLVKDLYGTTLDSVVYSSAWHNKNLLVTKNKSLERINPSLNANDRSNWSTSVAVEGSTPAKANSIYTENLSHNSKVSISPNPFSPDNDGFEDFAIINFDLPYKLSQVRIKVFDSKGRLVRTLLENRPTGANNSVIFNGLDDEGRALRIGIYILLIEISTEGSNNLETIKTPIVVARKL